MERGSVQVLKVTGLGVSSMEKRTCYSVSGLHGLCSLVLESGGEARTACRGIEGAAERAKGENEKGQEGVSSLLPLVIGSFVPITKKDDDASSPSSTLNPQLIELRQRNVSYETVLAGPGANKSVSRGKEPLGN